MDALQLLLERRSCARLTLPAPCAEVLGNILAAGMRAPDHGGLAPWEFVVAAAAGLDTLSSIFQRAAVAGNEDENARKKAHDAPYRAPMIITVIARTKKHPKVPFGEQLITAGCAVHAMQMAAVAQGFQGYWRTGKRAYDPVVRAAFDLKKDDEIVGFLYLGTAVNSATVANLPPRDLTKYVTYL